MAPTTGDDRTVLDAVVVGAGPAGLRQLAWLRAAGLTVRAVDAAGDVGGSWWWHGYPGARLDVDGALHQELFDEDPCRAWGWSERFPAGYEVLRWLRFVVDRLDLRRDLRLATRVVGLDRDPDGSWWVRTDRDGPVRTRSVVLCTGNGSAPVAPGPRGVPDFAGTVLRTAGWPQRRVDLAGTRTGVLGVGATGVQMVPALADRVAHLTVLAGAPVDVLARVNPMHGWAERERDAARVAGLRDVLARSDDGLEPAPVLGDGATAAALADDGSTLLWRAGVRAGTGAEVARVVRARMRERLADPAAAAVLVPPDDAPARPPALDLGFLETFRRDDVALVDVRANPVARVLPDGVELADGTRHPLDVLVLTDEVGGGGRPLDPPGDDDDGLFVVDAPPGPGNAAPALHRRTAEVARAVAGRALSAAGPSP